MQCGYCTRIEQAYVGGVYVLITVHGVYRIWRVQDNPSLVISSVERLDMVIKRFMTKRGVSLGSEEMRDFDWVATSAASSRNSCCAADNATIALLLDIPTDSKNHLRGSCLVSKCFV